ncbi:hypothetical protein OS21_42440 [Dickeya oryzae]
MKRLGGRYQLLTRYYIKNQTIEMNGGRVVDTQVRELPAINATSLDNGDPGSAWRDCMKGKKRAGTGNRDESVVSQTNGLHQMQCPAPTHQGRKPALNQ